MNHNSCYSTFHLPGADRAQVLDWEPTPVVSLGSWMPAAAEWGKPIRAGWPSDTSSCSNPNPEDMVAPIPAAVKGFLTVHWASLCWLLPAFFLQRDLFWNHHIVVIYWYYRFWALCCLGSINLPVWWQEKWIEASDVCRAQRFSAHGQAADRAVWGLAQQQLQCSQQRQWVGRESWTSHLSWQGECTGPNSHVRRESDRREQRIQ